MSELVPQEVLDAEAGGRALALQSLTDLRRLDPTRGILALWAMAESRSDLEYSRHLAVHACSCAEFAEQACLIWLMEHRSNDIGVANSILSSIESSLVERSTWPLELGGTLLLNFLRACLRHEEQSVQAGVLSVLYSAHHVEKLSNIFLPLQRHSLASELEYAVGPFADEDELIDLADVVESLHAEDEGDSCFLPNSSRKLSRISFDLLDWAEQKNLSTALMPLVSCVKRRALLEDASARALRDMRPVQTFRILSTDASTRLVHAIVAFSAAVVQVSPPEQAADTTTEDNDNDTAANDSDYRMKLAWAPAASVPMHLIFDEDNTRLAFKILSDLISAEGNPESVTALIEGIEPSIAAGLVRLIHQARKFNESFEVVLTDPELEFWQSTIVLGPDSISQSTIRALTRRERTTPGGIARILSRDVPQANTVRGVFEAVDAMLSTSGTVDITDIQGITTQRQVSYYKHGARVLGFFDEDNEPTGRARAIAELSHEDRLRLTAIFFEDSTIGRAWRTWAGVNRLIDVDPESAAAFLDRCAINLSVATRNRRASTLKSWYNELMSSLQPTYSEG